MADNDEPEGEAQQLHHLEELWAALSKDEQEFHNDLKRQAAADLSYSEELRARGEIHRADEAFRRGEELLQQADDMIKQAREAFRKEQEVQKREWEVLDAGVERLMAVLRDDLEQVRRACGDLTDAVRTSTAVNDEDRQRILAIYTRLNDEFDQVNNDQSTNALLNTLQRFVSEVHSLPASDVKARWKKLTVVLGQYLPAS